jgi:hypothetical protein
MNNPYISALAAMSYIGGLMLFLLPVLGYLDKGGDVEVFAPFIILSLLVLSVATMAFLFFYQPLLFIIDRKHKEAVNYFMRVIGTFAVGTVVVIALAGFVKFTVIANDVYCENSSGEWILCAQLEETR